jgi:hypothetical protein
MKKHMIQTILSTALLSLAPLALAQEFPTTPQPETLQQAIQFEKHKDAADAAQARKEAGETARASKATAAKTARAKSARKTVRQTHPSNRQSSGCRRLEADKACAI